MFALTPDVNAKRKSGLTGQRGTSRSFSSDLRRLRAPTRSFHRSIVSMWASRPLALETSRKLGSAQR
jgi:hypothetical protein